MQGENPWMIRVKGAFEITPFLMYIRERKAFLITIPFILVYKARSGEYSHSPVYKWGLTWENEYRINLVGYKEEIT